MLSIHSLIQLRSALSTFHLPGAGQVPATPGTTQALRRGESVFKTQCRLMLHVQADACAG